MRVFVFILLFIGSTSFAQSTLDYDKYELFFSEDFNKTKEELLSSGNWSTEFPWGDGESVSCFENVRIGCMSKNGCRKNIVDVAKESNLSIENGQLIMKLKQNSEWKNKEFAEKDCYYLYEGAVLRSNFREELPQDKFAADYGKSKDWARGQRPEYYRGFLYGLFEIECTLPENNAYYPAFWLYATRGTYPEIDVFEFDRVNNRQYTFFNNVHWQMKDKQLTSAQYKVKNEDLFDGPHTWAVDWSPDSISFYLDGEFIRAFTQLPKDKSSWRKVDIILSLAATFKGKKSAYFKKNPKKFDDSQVFAIDEVRVFKRKRPN